ncbi:MAG TPA: GNAT family N-acetyltransferase [Streptosporangiaceae bacterium]
MTHADWRTTADAREFLAEAGPVLQADPVENTLLLTIAHAAQGSAPGPTSLFGWHPGGGAFVHTPGFPLMLGPMPEAAATGLAATLGQHGRAISGVNGVPGAAQAFAARWQHTANPPAGSRLFQRQRLFRLAELTPPPPPAGRARVATTSDRELLTAWTNAFHREANHSGRPDSGPVVDSRLTYGGQLLWETGVEPGRPVATAARTPVVGGMSRVAPVYTPPEQRGKGYGGAITVAVSRAARQAGAREVVLFTDLANPTSNALYRRLGYRPVSDRHVLLFRAS